MAPAVSWKSSSCCRNRMACGRTAVNSVAQLAVSTETDPPDSRCSSARAPFRPWACCTPYPDHSAITGVSVQPVITDNRWIGGRRPRVRARCLDAVSELLQSFGPDGFHGGDERGQLILGAGRRSLQQTKISSVLLRLTTSHSSGESADLQGGVKL